MVITQTKLKKILTLSLLVLTLSLAPIQKTEAIPAFPSCDLKSTFTNTYLANAKTALNTAGFTPEFNHFTAPAILIRNPDNPATIYMYIGDNAAKMEIDTSYGLQIGAKTTATAQIYRIVFSETGTVNQATKIGNGFSTYPAQAVPTWCVQGIKNGSGTPTALSDVTYRFPKTDGLTPFGNATFTQEVSSGGGGGTTPAPTEITERDQKLIALGVASFAAFLLIKPFRYRQGNKNVL